MDFFLISGSKEFEGSRGECLITFDNKLKMFEPNFNNFKILLSKSKLLIKIMRAT